MANFDFQQKLINFHPKNILKDVTLAENEIKLPNLIKLIKSDNVVIDNALKDFKKFLKSSFDVNAEIDKSEFGFNLSTVVDSSLKFNGYIISVSDSSVLVKANSDRNVAQGIFYIEFLTFEKKSPILNKGEIKVEIPYSPRIAHSGYALDEFPNEYLSNLAHFGYDAIAVYVKGVNLSRTGAYDFNDLVKRAKSYGIDVYLYASFGRFIDVYSEDSDKEFDEVYGAVFENCKGAKGIVLVGESVEFASRDERVAQHSNRQKPLDNLRENLPTPGWYPCRDYPLWVEKVQKSIKKHNPNADIVFWTYNWGWAPEKDRVELIKNLPKDVSLNVTFEMFEHYDVFGSNQTVTDYSIAKADAGSYFKSEAKTAKECGIKLYSMTNSAGRTWDFGTIPYMPFPMQWLKRFEEVNKAKTEYNLQGLMETHHYGFYPSFIARLNQLCQLFPNDLQNNLKRVFKAYFENTSSELYSAFEDISEAITYLPPSIEGQYGPCRNGTAYPLCLTKSVKPPRLEITVSGDAFWPGYYGQFEENMGLGFSDIGVPYGLRHKQEIKMLKKMLELLKSGIKKLSDIKDKNKELISVLNIVKYVNCSVKTFLNAKLFYTERVALKLCDNPKKMLEICARIRKIAQNEIENAKSSIKYLKKDSSLGYEASMGYVGGVERVEWKIKQVQNMLDSDVAYYETQVKKYFI